MTPVEYEAEIIRLHAFTMQLAEKPAAACAVLSTIAVRTETRLPGPPRLQNSDRNEEEKA